MSGTAPRQSPDLDVTKGAAMAVRDVLRMGDPRLRRKSDPVDDVSKSALGDLIGDMLDTMRACDGAGIAAPQIGVPLRVVIFGVESNPRYPDAPPVPMTVLINPDISPVGAASDEAWEGCLSVPGMRGLVPRFSRIHYRGLDAAGQLIDRTADGFHARVVQHECDHLDGVLYPDRIKKKQMFGFIPELLEAGLLGPVELPAE